MSSIRLIVEPIQSLDNAVINGTYMGIGPRFDHTARVVVVANYTNGILMFSWNGIDDHFPLYISSSLVLTICNNDEAPVEYFAVPALSRLYVRTVNVVSAGTVYITQFRGLNDA